MLSLFENECLWPLFPSSWPSSDSELVLPAACLPHLFLVALEQLVPSVIPSAFTSGAVSRQFFLSNLFLCALLWGRLPCTTVSQYVGVEDAIEALGRLCSPCWE